MQSTTSTPSMSLTVSIPLARIYSLIITAHESGAGYWARNISETVPSDADLSWMDDPEDAARWPDHVAALVGGSVVYGVVDADSGKVGRKRYTLNAETLAKGLTIILVEQNFRFAAPLADRHYVMEHGQIVATVHKDELDNKAQMLNEYLGV